MNGWTSETDDNTIKTLYSFVRHLNVRVTLTTVREQLLNHPSYPSLLSLSEVLAEWKIENSGLQLKTTEQLRELPLPFIAHLHRNDGWYVLVTAQQGDQITYFDSDHNYKSKTLANFEREWSGAVLIAEVDKQAGEPYYQLNRRQEFLEEFRKSFIWVSSLLFFSLATLNAAPYFALSDWLMLISKTSGLVLSSLLVIKQLGYDNTLFNRLCQINGKTNCDSVLNSPAAKLWGWLSWSDVGLLYFTSGLLVTLVAGIASDSDSAGVRSLVHMLGLLALAYTVFSIYYQARIVRQWCPLCLGVQGVLLIEGGIAITQLSRLPASWQPYAITITVFLLPTLLWLLVKPLLLSVTKSQRQHNELLWLKRDPNLFKALLTTQTPMPFVPNDLCPIVLGNADAEHTITMVTNPYCPPCAEVHKELEELVERNTHLKINVILMACDGPEGKKTVVAKHILSLPDKEQAMHDWYEPKLKDYATWSNKYPITNIDPYYIQLAQRHCDWCQQAGITGTPTLYINGHQLPSIYSLSQVGRLTKYLTSSVPFKTELL